MKVIAWSQNLTPEKCQEAGVDYASREHLLRNADIVTIHLQLSDRSRGLPGRKGPRADEAERVPRQHVPRTNRRREGVDFGAHCRPPRRRRPRRVPGRTAAGRSPVPQARRQRRAHPAPRLRQRRELRGKVYITATSASPTSATSSTASPSRSSRAEGARFQPWTAATRTVSFGWKRRVRQSSADQFRDHHLGDLQHAS